MCSRTDARVKWSSSATATKNFKCRYSTAVLYELRLNSATGKSWTTYRDRTYGAVSPADRQIRRRHLPVQSGVKPLCRRSEEHTSELQSHLNLVCRLLLEKKKTHKPHTTQTE